MPHGSYTLVQLSSQTKSGFHLDTWFRDGQNEVSLNKGWWVLKPYIIKGWPGMAKLISGMAGAIPRHPLNETLQILKPMVMKINKELRGLV